MIINVASFGVRYFLNQPLDAIRFVKTVPFDWASQFGCLPVSLGKCYSLFIVLDEYASVKDFLEALRQFSESLCDLDSLLSLTADDILKGDEPAVRNMINLASETLNLIAVFGSKFNKLSGVYVNYLEIGSSLFSLAKDLQDLIRVLDGAEIDGQQNIYEIFISVCRNSISISRSVIEASVRQYLMLTCGSAYSVTKLALFILNNKN